MVQRPAQLSVRSGEVELEASVDFARQFAVGIIREICLHCCQAPRGRAFCGALLQIVRSFPILGAPGSGPQVSSYFNFADFFLDLAQFWSRKPQFRGELMRFTMTDLPPVERRIAARRLRPPWLWVSPSEGERSLSNGTPEAIRERNGTGERALFYRR